MHPPIDFKYLVLQITAIPFYRVIINPLQKKKKEPIHIQCRSIFFQIFHLCLDKFMDSDTESVSTWSSAYNYKIFFLSLNTMMNNHTLMISVASLLFYGSQFLPTNTSTGVENRIQKEQTWKVNPHDLKPVEHRISVLLCRQTTEAEHILPLVYPSLRSVPINKE